MTSMAVRLMPHLLAWGAMLLLLARGCAGRRGTVAAAAGAGFIGGIVAAPAAARLLGTDASFDTAKIVLGAAFLVYCAVAVAALYGSGRSSAANWGERLTCSAPVAAAGAFFTGVAGGAVCGFRSLSGSVTTVCAAAAAGLLLLPLMLLVERRLPAAFVVSPASLVSGITSLLLFTSSSLLRLDLFSPLTMKVMKFSHDFVHQFFESMLIPDHLFFTARLWGFVGVLFSNAVGFWGALVVWLAPALLVICAVALEPLPAVAHLREGARRRKTIAAAIRAKRQRLAVPLLALAVFSCAVYQSKFPAVEYWDPKPIQVSASPAGEIFIPKKGEVDLEDGKLHKFLFKKGGTEARFFIVMTPAGGLTVVLDACSICKPDGYGQTEGTVICYYCKTLIPLDTVGRPGGCNPVPLPCALKADGVHIDGVTLVNRWVDTVQATARVGGEGK